MLTKRERTIVGLLKRRLGNKEIAAALKISEGTVKFHLSNVFRKLGVRDRRSVELTTSQRGCF
jgi:DNA-binding NarL/FixJ family response regulator